MGILYDVAQVSALLPTLARIPVSSVHLHVADHLALASHRVSYRVTLNFNLTAALTWQAQL